MMIAVARRRRLSELLDKTRALRLGGRYHRGAESARALARMAGRGKMPDLELEAYWELLEDLKALHPERRGLLCSVERRASRLARCSGDERLRLEAQIRQAALWRTLGEHERAAAALTGVIGHRALTKDRQLSGYACWNLAFALRMLLKLDRAAFFFHRAARIFESTGDASGLAYAMSGLAGVTRLMNRPQASLGYYRRALALFQREKDDPYGLAYANCGSGNALRRLGRFRRAVAHYNRAHRIYRRLRDAVNEGYVCWGRYVCLRALGRRSEAGRDLKRALGLFKKTKDRRGLALCQVWAGLPLGVTDIAALREAHRS